jgi:glycosyltransferase involved in cell wall biosynthesis
VTYHAWIAAKTGFHPMIVSAWGSDIYSDAEKSKKYRGWVEEAFTEADMILTTSKTLRNFISKHYSIKPGKIMRFYWGQDLEIFKTGSKFEVEKFKQEHGINAEDFVVLSSRNMKPLYGIKDIIEIIPLIIKKKSNVKFIVLRGYGEEEYINQLKALINKLGIEEYVVFIDKLLSTKELAVVNNVADLVITLPSYDQTSSAVKEAMACGAIPLVNDLEVYHEIVENGRNGFLVDKANKTEVAQRIIYCIDNHPELKNKFSKINRELLEQESDWNKNNKLMLKIYEEIIEKMKI